MPLSIRPQKKHGVWLALALTTVGGFEGMSYVAYKPIPSDPWTICAGDTFGVKKGDTAMPAECNARLQERILQFNTGLTRCIPKLNQFPDKTHVALVSWAYNVGLGAACSSTLARKANAGDLIGACNQLPRWSRAGGHVLSGLLKRRNAERAMCLEGAK